MILEIKKLFTQGKYIGEFSFDFQTPQELTVLPLCKIKEVKVSGAYEIFEDLSVRIDLELSYKLTGQCSYCLEPVEKTVIYPSELIFTPYEEDGDGYSYDGYKINLEKAVCDALVISQPSVLLCKEGCEGIKINQDKSEN